MNFRVALSLTVLIVIFTNIAYSAMTPEDPKRQTSWGLYVTAQETYEMKQRFGNQMLFIDVRDPIEIMFTGFTNVVDVNIPFKLADRTQWNPQKSVFKMAENPNFEKEVASALVARGLSKEVPVVIMCRSGGTRGAPATKLLEGKGYDNVYVVTDGFEGSTLKDGEKKNWRLKNGWKNAGLPWSYKLNEKKIYLSKENPKR
jgi:rhodanese-related sulfurtransferase